MFPLQASITTGILIIIIMVIRRLTKKTLPKATYYILWKISLLELLVPVSVTSLFSIYNVIVFPGAQSIFDMIAVKSTSVGDIITLITYRLIETELNSGINLLSIVWLAGFLATALFFVSAWIRFRRLNSVAIPVKDNAFIENWLDVHRIRRPVRVFTSEKLATPIAAGLLRPKIILPGFLDLGDTRQLDYILRHELIHIKRYDGLWKLLSTAAVCIHWFNPVVWLLFWMISRDMELSCDEQVIKGFDNDAREAYALSLLYMAQLQTGLMSVGVGYSAGPAEERIVSVMKYKRASVAVILAASLVISSVTGIFGTTASDAKGGFFRVTIGHTAVKIINGQLVYFFPDTFQLFRQVAKPDSTNSETAEAAVQHAPADVAPGTVSD